MKERVFKKPMLQFMYRFAVLHTVTYLIFGILFMLLTDCFGVFARDPLLSIVMKPADALSVRLAAPAQVP
jgi:hypothetical protein